MKSIKGVDIINIFADSLAKGDIIMLSSSEYTVKQSFENNGYRWDDQMKGMLGKEFPVLDIKRDDLIALPSPNDSANGKWYFSISVVKKVTGKNEKYTN